MRKILLSLAAVTALAAAGAPAAAQSWRNNDHDDRRYDDRSYGGGQLTTGYVDGLAWKIDNAAQERRISWNEARGLKSELRQIQPLAWRVQTGQASGWERRRLTQGVNRIEAAVNSYDRYGRNDRRDDRRWR